MVQLVSSALFKKTREVASIQFGTISLSNNLAAHAVITQHIERFIYQIGNFKTPFFTNNDHREIFIFILSSGCQHIAEQFLINLFHASNIFCNSAQFLITIPTFKENGIFGEATFRIG